MLLASQIWIWREGWEMTHWEQYALWAISGSAGFGGLRYASQVFLMAVGALTKNTQRSWQCAVMLALMRKNPMELLRLLLGSREQIESPAAKAHPSETTACQHSPAKHYPSSQPNRLARGA
jgi:hypothetical protein